MEPRLQRPPDLTPAARRSIVLPVIVFLLALLGLWTLSVFLLRDLGGLPGPLRQLYPLVLWMAAIVFWIYWQRIARPAESLGLVPLTRIAIGAAVVAFVAVLAWHAIRVGLSRQPGGLLGEIPPVLYIWLAAGVFLNELLFRGVIQPWLSDALGETIAIVIAALFTVLFRLPSYFTTTVPVPIDPTTLFGIFLFGLLAGLLRYYTRSLWPAVALQWGNSLGSLL